MKKKYFNFFTTIFAVLFIASCGGGGKGESGWTPSSHTSSHTTSSEDHSTSQGDSSNPQNTYSFTFKNYDETTLYVDHVSKGGSANYRGQKPSRPSKVEGYTYKFNGKWTTTNGGSTIDNLDNVTSNRTVYAMYDLVKATYTVTYYDYKGDILKQYPNLDPGSEFPQYYGERPTKPSTLQCHYDFNGWDIDNDGIADEIDYIYVYQDYDAYPLFRTIDIKYKITFLDDNGETLSYRELTYGSLIEVPAVEDEPINETTIKKFLGWDINDDGVVDTLPETVVGDMTAKAIFEVTTRKYTITFYNVVNNEYVIYQQYEGEYDDEITVPDPIPTTYPEEGKYITHTEWRVYSLEYGSEYYVKSYFATDTHWDIRLTYNYVVYPTLIDGFEQYHLTIYKDDEKTDAYIDSDFSYGSALCAHNFGLPTPEKAETSSHTYNFIGWEVKYDPTYHGDYYNTDYYLDFMEFDDSFIIFCDMELIPVFESIIKTFEVLFWEYGHQGGNNWGWIVTERIEVPYGEPAVYPGGTPQSWQVHYGIQMQFQYWTNEHEHGGTGSYYQGSDFGDTPITQYEELYAKYTQVEMHFTVSFYNEDGTELLGTQDVTYWTDTLVCDTPTKESDETYYYTFSHWSREIGGEAITSISGTEADFSVYANFEPHFIPEFDAFYPDGDTNIGINGNVIAYYDDDYSNPTLYNLDDFVYDNQKLEFVDYKSIYEGDRHYGYTADHQVYEISDPTNIVKPYDFAIRKIDSFGFLTMDGDIYVTGVPAAWNGNYLIGDNPYLKFNAPDGVKFVDFAGLSDNSDFTLLALSEDGDLYTAGYNKSGCLGIGTDVETFVYTLTKLNITENEEAVKFKKIATSWQSCFAVDINGYAWCWGRDEHCSLTTSNNLNIRPTPFKFDDVQKFKEIYFYSLTGMGIDENNKLIYWGYNSKYEVGSSGQNLHLTIHQFAENWEIVPVDKIALRGFKSALYVNHHFYYGRASGYIRVE